MKTSNDYQKGSVKLVKRVIATRQQAFSARRGQTVVSTVVTTSLM